MRYTLGNCGVCEEPLKAALGQRIRFHKECRKEGRKRFGKATGDFKFALKNGKPAPFIPDPEIIK